MFGGVAFLLIQLKSRRGGMPDCHCLVASSQLRRVCTPLLFSQCQFRLAERDPFSKVTTLPSHCSLQPSHTEMPSSFIQTPLFFPSFYLSSSGLSLSFTSVLFPSPKWDFKTCYTFHLTIHHHSQSILCSCLTTFRFSFYFQSPLLSPAPSLSTAAPTLPSSFLVSISSPVLHQSAVIKL